VLGGVIDYIEEPEVAPAFEWVVHEVHRPDFIDGCGHGERLGFVTIEALLGFDPHLKLQVLVNAVDPIRVPGEVLHIA